MGFFRGVKDFVFQKGYDEENYYDDVDDNNAYFDEEDDIPQIGSGRGYTPRGADRKKDDTIELTSRPVKPKNDDGVYSFQDAFSSKIVIAAPKNIEDASHVCELLKANSAVAINLEDVDTKDSQRIMDFIAGVTHAVNGDITQVSNRIFIASPKSVEVTEQLKEQLKAQGIFPSFGLKSAFSK